MSRDSAPSEFQTQVRHLTDEFINTDERELQSTQAQEFRKLLDGEAQEDIRVAGQLAEEKFTGILPPESTVSAVSAAVTSEPSVSQPIPSSFVRKRAGQHVQITNVYTGTQPVPKRPCPGIVAEQQQARARWDDIRDGNKYIQLLHGFAQLVSGKSTLPLSHIWIEPGNELVQQFDENAFEQHYRRFFGDIAQFSIAAVLKSLRDMVRRDSVAPGQNLEPMYDIMRNDNVRVALAATIGQDIAQNRGEKARNPVYQTNRRSETGRRELLSLYQELGRTYAIEFLGRRY